MHNLNPKYATDGSGLRGPLKKFPGFLHVRPPHPPFGHLLPAGEGVTCMEQTDSGNSSPLGRGCPALSGTGEGEEESCRNRGGDVFGPPPVAECAYQNAATCPDCGDGMIRLGVCFSCPACGFESCSV